MHTTTPLPQVNDNLPETIRLACERNRVRTTQLGRWSDPRFKGKFRSIPDGTVIFDDTLIWGYPKIGRILALDTGLKAQLHNPFWIEEKIDGYNVRIFRQDDAILAITRRGYLCPFTMDRLGEFIDLRLFDEHPELVLCAEMAGPENPYNEGSPPFIQEDIQLFVFDIMYKNFPACLPYRDKLALMETYGLPGPTRYGRFASSDLEQIRTLILQLDQEGREGIVLKEDCPEDRRVKYVTGRSNIGDIQVNNGSIQQLPPEYMLHRVLRLALFLEEHGLTPTPDIYQDLGQALVDGTLSAIRQYREHHKVLHTFRCRFRHRANAELMMRDVRRRLGRFQVRQREIHKEGEYYILEFDKVLPRSTGLFAQLLKGGIVFD